MDVMVTPILFSVSPTKTTARSLLLISINALYHHGGFVSDVVTPEFMPGSL
jgi:hypothetical protein